MKSARKRPASKVVVAAMLALACLGARAGTGNDHDRARKALEAGDILPLRTILDRTESIYPGQVLEVELERKDKVWIYEIKILQSGGLVVKLKINARDGSVINSKDD